MTQMNLTRRQVIERAMQAAGFATVAGSATLLVACAEPETRNLKAATNSVDDVAWLDEVAETILPQTDTPGAKAAGVGAFIALMVADTYAPSQQAVFRAGMVELEAECRASTGAGFMVATPDQRLQLLTRLDEEAMDHLLTKAADDSPHYFRMLKELTLLGYFTSEIGYTQAMRYVETPGRFDPCVDYQAGEKTWARHA